MEMPIDMQHQQMGYDRAATMFSPDGHLLQVEYAEKTVRLGSASVGIVCSDGVFILADKRNMDKLVVPESAQKIYEIDSHIISSVAGIMSDARVLIDQAQVVAQKNRVTYDSEIEPEVIIKEISNTKQKFTQYGGARPFGVSLMVAGIGKKPVLYTSDITGNYFSYFANAIGEKDDKVKEKLREKYKAGQPIKKNVKLALDILKEVQGEAFEMKRLEIAYIKPDERKLKRLEGEKIEELLK